MQCQYKTSKRLTSCHFPRLRLKTITTWPQISLQRQLKIVGFKDLRTYLNWVSPIHERIIENYLSENSSVVKNIANVKRVTEKIAKRVFDCAVDVGKNIVSYHNVVLDIFAFEHILLNGCNWTRTQNLLVCKRTLNHLAKLAKWLNVHLWNSWFWVWFQLQSLKLQISRLL